MRVLPTLQWVEIRRLHPELAILAWNALSRARFSCGGSGLGGRDQRPQFPPSNPHPLLCSSLLNTSNRLDWSAAPPLPGRCLQVKQCCPSLGLPTQA